MDDVVTRAHELIAGPVGEATRAVLDQATTDWDLHFDGRPSCRVLRPHFVHASQWREAQRAAGRVARVLALAQKCLLDDTRLRRRFLHLWTREVAHVRHELHTRQPNPVARFDGLVDPSGTLRLIEYTSPADGAFKMEHLARAFSASPLLAALRRRVNATSFHTLAAEERAMRSGHRRWGARGAPRFAVVGAPGYLERADKDEIRNWFRHAASLGWPVHVVTADQLVFRKGTLYAKDAPVDVVFVSSWAGLEELPPAHPLFRASRAGSAWIWNGLRLTTLHAKALFALVTDPAWSGFLPARGLRGVLRHLPWTRIVRKERTTFHGRDVDLVELLHRQRESFVLKPSIGSGGSGVVCGWATTNSAWERALESALEQADQVSQFVAQERVVHEPSVFPFRTGRGHELYACHHDLSPFVWGGTTVHGAFVRLGKGPVLNVVASPESSVTPLFVVEGR